MRLLGRDGRGSDQNGKNPDDTNNVPNILPFAWAIIPLVAIFLITTLIIIFCMRRRRRLMREGHLVWTRERQVTAGGYVVYVQRTGLGTARRRWAPWGATRSQEGLNELGEAPPPYDGKKGSVGTIQAGSETDMEMRGLESAPRPPPDYISSPAPAVTIDSRRTER